MPDPLVIEEAAPPVDVHLRFEVVKELSRLGVCDVTPGTAPGIWQLRNVRKVGVVRLNGQEIVIKSKVPIPNLLWMLSFADGAVDWRPESVRAIEGESLTQAMARAYATALERATSGGLVRSYRDVEQSSQIVRGRWDTARQIRVRQGSPLPAEITFDEFDVDTPENRVLLAALVRLLRFPGLTPDLFSRLRTLTARFDGVQTMTWNAAPGRWQPTRRTKHLESAYRLAVLVLSRRGIEHHAGGMQGTAFLVTMSTVFERFIEAQVRRAATALGVAVTAQESRSLDVAGRAIIRPDLVLRRDGEVVAVIDAKYKQEKPSGFPNADIYQALTYAIRFGVREVQLLYAKGLGDVGEYVIERAGVVVRCVAVELAGTTPDEAGASVEAVVRQAIPARDLSTVAAGVTTADDSANGGRRRG